MASIPGSHFVATTSGLAVNVVETSGGGLPPPIPGQFNLEIWTGNPTAAPSNPAPGYQGLAVLSHGGQEIDLIAGAFTVTDDGTGQDTVDAHGESETITGGTANVTLNLFGNNDIANGGGQDTIAVLGQFDTVNGVGNDSITIFGDHDSVNAGTGNDTIMVFGAHDTIAAGSGNEVITLFGDQDRLKAGTGNETVNAFGAHDSISANTGNAVIHTYGANSTIVGGYGNETIQAAGDHSLVKAGTGLSDITITGNHDTVDAGNATISAAHVTVGGSDFTFNDGRQTYFDTIVGFNQSAGDRIHLTTESVSDALAHSTQVNSGHDTLITLNDGSTILLKGITHIDHSFFT